MVAETTNGDTGRARPCAPGPSGRWCTDRLNCEDEGMDKQQEFVLRTLEERDIRFVRLWFTDVLGFLKSVAVAPAELEQAFDEGIGFDGSAIELRPGLRVRHDRQAGPEHLPDTAVARRGPRDRPDVLRHPDAGRLPVLRGPALRPQAHPGQDLRPGLHLLHPPGDRVLPAEGQAAGRLPPGAGGQLRLLRPHSAERRHGLPPPGDHHARIHGHLGGVQPPRGPRASRRSTSATPTPSRRPTTS